MFAYIAVKRIILWDWLQLWRISLLWYRMLTCWKCCSASSRVINERPVSLQVSPEKKKQTSTTATSVGNSWACQVCDKCVRESPVCMQCSVSQVCLQHLMCLHLKDPTEFLIKLDSLGIEIRQVISQVFNRALVVVAFSPRYYLEHSVYEDAPLQP